MDRFKSLHQNKSFLLHRQARNSVFYQVLQHEKHEVTTIPINGNTLGFSSISQKFLETIYLDSTLKTLSAEFYYNMLIFFLYFFSVSVIILISAIALHIQNSMSKNSMTFHIVCLGTFLSTLLITLIIVSKKKNSFKYIREFFCIFGCLWLTYLTVADQGLLCKITQDSECGNFINFPLSTIGFIIYYRFPIYDSFIHMLIPSIWFLVLTIILNSAISAKSQTVIFSDFAQLMLIILLQIIETQKVTSRISHLFYRLYCEELKAEILGSQSPNKNVEILGSNEIIIEKCDNVISEINITKKSIIFNDIKEKLKNCLADLKEIRSYLGRYGFSDTISFIEDSKIDNEDKEFINQNFLNISRASIKSRGENRNATLKDLIERKIHFTYSVNMLESSFELLEKIGQEWNFDMLEFKDSVENPISIIGKHMFHRWHLEDVLGVKKEVVYLFFENLEVVIFTQNYKSNPYHNSAHAADVFSSLYYFITEANIEKSLNTFESVSCLIASLAHDLGHPGLTNRYLISSKDSLAIRYNDNSVLENMHCAMLYTILSNPDQNILGNISNDYWILMRKLIIEMIINTDMSRHFELLTRFRSRASYLNDLNIENQDDKSLLLSFALKCADLGHSAKSFDLHEKWSLRVCEEFFKQGDIEKEKKLPISMYCDRENTDIPKSQSGFLKNVCLPLFEAFSTYVKSNRVDKDCISQIKENYTRWEESSKYKYSPTIKIQIPQDKFLTKMTARFE